MMYLAAISPAELIPIFGVLAGMLVAFYALVKFMLNQAENGRAADREERQELAKAFMQVAESNREIAAETRNGNQEAEKRNGHLAELSLQSQELLRTIGDRNYNAIIEVREQYVGHQTIANETVVGKVK